MLLRYALKAGLQKNWQSNSADMTTNDLAAVGCEMNIALRTADITRTVQRALVESLQTVCEALLAVYPMRQRNSHARGTAEQPGR